ncbi:hypothetical protein [Halorubrum sp. DTA98]|uniref:hypothetical protein n=1 Tax=Halorubrum sp. DTA98 TaxID=3402163 RepID=UPI003AB0F958
MNGSGEADLHEIDRFERGVGWIAYPEEAMERASHALAVHDEEGETDEVWVIDPVDAPGVDDLLAEFGEVAGVVCALDRHKRDCAAIATRHDVAVHVPDWMSGVAEELDAPVERFGRRLADTGFEAIRIRNSAIPPWQEVGLYDGETLVVPESLGSAAYFRGDRERLGVHPMLRLTPPRETLSGLNPERVLVGHGVGVLDDAARTVERALDGSRRKAPGLYAKTIRSMIGL